MLFVAINFTQLKGI